MLSINNYNPTIHKTNINTRNYGNNISFGKSEVNIVATSDNHGLTDAMPKYYQLIQTKIRELFGKKETLTPKSTANVAVFNGDWFMNPKPKGYLSKNNLCNGDIQYSLLRSFIYMFKSEDENSHVLFNLGNHDLDGGAYKLFKYLKASGATTLLSNTKIETSTLFKELNISEETKNKKFVPEYIVNVQDDKDPNINNKVLFLGITTPAMKNYIPEGIDNIDIADKNSDSTTNCPETIKAVNDKIKKFKAKYPEGSVVLLTHTGGKVAQHIVSNIDIAPDLIINGHDHKDTETTFTVNNKKVKMVSLYENCEKVDSIKLHFDDNGKLKDISTNKFYHTDIKEDQPDNVTSKKTNKILKKDIVPHTFIKSDVPLSIEGVRNSNNHLANFITDNILEAINKTNGGEDTDLFCIPSTAFRKSLTPNEWVSNTDILNLLNGNVENISRVYTGQATGEDVVSMVLENMILHKGDEFKHTILQWSGLKINKKILVEIGNALNLEKQQEFTGEKRTEYISQAIANNAIEIKDKDGKYKPINLNKTYKLALPNYFFIKNRVPTASNLGLCPDTTFKPLNKTMIELLKDNITEKVVIKPDERIIN
ncbi:MAG: metallophosphoesterase [Vampirovibrionia bacterium]